MSDSDRKSWEGLKTVLTFASVFIAGLALWQTHQTSNQQEELSAKTLALQQRVFDRSQSSVDFGLIQIFLEFPDRATEYYPELGGAGESTTVPYDKWASSTGRWVQFRLQNRGTSTVYVESAGIGVDNNSSAAAASKFCKDKLDGYKWGACPREIPPGAENLYVFALDRDSLTTVKQDWQAKGLEVCVGLEAYGTTCQRSWAAMPAGFLQPLP